MKLERFIDVSGLGDMTETNKALHFAFYHLKEEKLEEFTTAVAAKWIFDAGLGTVNSARLKQNLGRSPSTVRGQEAGSFKLHRNFVKEMDGKFPQLIEKSQEVSDEGTILPPAMYEKTRGWIVSLSKQINVCYEQNAFDGCAVLMRRLEEVLLIMAFVKLGIEGEIKNGKDYMMLEGIVSNAQGNGKLGLSRTGRQMAEDVRQLGNLSAHGITYQCTRDFIREKIEGYRALVQELLAKAGLR
jgi:hypothetical protein